MRNNIMTHGAMIPAPFARVARDRVVSTQIEGKALAAEGAPGWTIVTAREQTGGRGRFDRSWSSPEGNLYATLILRPARGEPPPGTPLPLVNLATGLALVEALHHLAPETDLSLKWPNDVLIGQAKIAGILTEAVATPAAPPVLLIGFGVNLNTHPADAPYPVTDLAASTPTRVWFDPEQALEAILPRLYDRIATFLAAGFDPLRPAYLARLSHVGKSVRVHLDAAKTQFVDGILKGIGPDGGLELETASGTRRIQAGDVMPIGTAEAPTTG